VRLLIHEHDLLVLDIGLPGIGGSKSAGGARGAPAC
jgi:hypothetical protein